MKHFVTAIALLLAVSQSVIAGEATCKVEGAADLKTMSHSWGDAVREIIGLERATCTL